MKTIASVAAIVLLSAAQGLAHHTVAGTVDVSRLVSLSGTVTSIDWKYPHVVYHLEVPDAKGAAVDWDIESRHPEGMRRDGVGPDTIKAGDRVIMNVMLALDGSRHAATASIVLADGRMLRVCTVTNDACPP